MSKIRGDNSVVECRSYKSAVPGSIPGLPTVMERQGCAAGLERSCRHGVAQKWADVGRPLAHRSTTMHIGVCRKPRSQEPVADLPKGNHTPGTFVSLGVPGRGGPSMRRWRLGSVRAMAHEIKPASMLRSETCYVDEGGTSLRLPETLADLAGEDKRLRRHTIAIRPKHIGSVAGSGWPDMAVVGKAEPRHDL